MQAYLFYIGCILLFTAVCSALHVLLVFAFDSKWRAQTLDRIVQGWRLINGQGMIVDVKPIQPAHNLPQTVAVVGAGIAGSGVAVALARQGRKVTVFERDMTEPDRIIGELLQPGGVKYLNLLGLSECVEGIDSCHTRGYQIHHKGEVTTIVYPDDEGKMTVGRGFHHGRFIMNLRKALLKEPNITVVEATVKGIVEEKGRVVGLKYRGTNDTEDQVFNADLTIVCDGSYSNLRRHVAPNAQTSSESAFVGFIVPVDCLPSESNDPLYGHVLLTKEAIVLAYPISSTEVRLFVDVKNSVPAGGVETYIREKVAPLIPEKLRNAMFAEMEAGRMRSRKTLVMPPQESKFKPGVFLLGDSFNCRHPLTGGGMTVAFSDCYQLAKALNGVDFSDTMQMRSAFETFKEERKALSATINILAAGLYGVFGVSEAPGMSVMRSACFDYLKKGGIFAAGPIGFLCGLIPSPNFLATHFFSVALYGMGKNLLPFPTPARIREAGQLLISASDIILPVIGEEKVTILQYLNGPFAHLKKALYV
eukprot:TRINITY_DN918_c0_g1_i4.p1 TRINITY_DN918_c0_g1~~TRINITY_DN918_c0_g1_i4.p1  ORF type:complete len:534 (+),score=139.58 TRINITY_DN918_c0_g1_i4:39-1640(+)